MFKVVKAFISGLSDTEKVLFYFTCCILVIMLFDRLVVGPVSERSAMLRNEIEAQEQLTEHNIRIMEYKDRIVADARRYRDFYAPEARTQEERIGTFLRDVENHAQASGITLSNVNPVQVPPHGATPIYRLNLEVTGTMENLMRFFHSIDSARSSLRVASFRIDVARADEHTVRCALEIHKLIVTSRGVPLDEEDPPADQEDEPSREVVFTDKVLVD